ncbi:hypothetical protein F1188_20375 [Roseospira marina]|uniref:Uncharacterized protein n=1 Tax=Roseospira marina TaxID=140057 RepID=A0A5M6I349_9PROT|nr:hypothetical protein [Roseospira marina]KAA5602631.1 hypothetical protein F1188_20375 [Roseospira marina]MBB4316250.1 hypothetical protein [Roseospira marina]MBB5089442.1 hypothetical protein [Roseospira marina]
MSAPPTTTAHRTFNTFLADVEDGQIHNELTDDLRDLVATLQNVGMETGGKASGEITVKLKLKLDGRSIDVVADVATKKPKMPRRRTTFFSTEDNRLTRNDPRQQALPFKTVEPSQTETKAV